MIAEKRIQFNFYGGLARAWIKIKIQEWRICGKVSMQLNISKKILNCTN